MIKFIKIPATLLFTLFLTSCATIPTRQVLTKQDRSNIISTRLLVNTTQREIVMQHNSWLNSDLSDPYLPMDSGAIVKHNEGLNPNAGLVGALIKAGTEQYAASVAIESLLPFRTTLEDFDFAQYFNTHLKNQVVALPWLKIEKKELKYNVLGTEDENAAKAKQNTTLFVGITYAIHSVFRQLEVSAYVKLIQKGYGKKASRTLYANNFYFVNRLSEPNINPNENKSRWLDNNGTLLKTKLRDAANILSSMISADLQNKYATTNQQIIFRTFYGVKAKGKMIKRENGYYIIELTDAIYAVNADDLIR